MKPFPRKLAFDAVWHQGHAAEGQVLRKNLNQAVGVGDAAELVLHYDDLLLAGLEEGQHGRGNACGDIDDHDVNGPLQGRKGANDVVGGLFIKSAEGLYPLGSGH